MACFGLQEQHLVIPPQLVRERGRRSAGLASPVPGHDPHDRGAARSAELLLYVSSIFALYHTNRPRGLWELIGRLRNHIIEWRDNHPVRAGATVTPIRRATRLILLRQFEREMSRSMEIIALNYFFLLRVRSRRETGPSSIFSNRWNFGTNALSRETIVGIQETRLGTFSVYRDAVVPINRCPTLGASMCGTFVKYSRGPPWTRLSQKHRRSRKIFFLFHYFRNLYSIKFLIRILYRLIYNFA